MITDTHCHLDSSEYAPDLDQVLQRARACGVSRIISIGASDGISSAERAIGLAEKHPHIWATVGVHPHDAGESYDHAHLEKLAQHKKVVAIGETGLDYHYDFAPKEAQFLCFRSQINLALKVKKPLVIHCRKAADDCFKLLADNNASEVGGVFHCFSESTEFARKLVDINFLISITGIVTFKKAEELRQTLREVPISRVMVETDGPFLAPEPYRGKRCEPSQIVKTIEALSKIYNLTVEETAAITSNNATTLFRLND